MRLDGGKLFLILAAGCVAADAGAADANTPAKSAAVKPAATPAPVAAKAPAKIQFTDKDIERVKNGGAKPPIDGPCEPTAEMAEATTAEAGAKPSTAKKKPAPYRGSSRPYRRWTPAPEPSRPDPARPDWQSQKKERETDAKWREKYVTEGNQAGAYMESRQRQQAREKWARQSAARSDKPLPPSNTAKDELREKKPIK